MSDFNNLQTVYLPYHLIFDITSEEFVIFQQVVRQMNG